MIRFIHRSSWPQFKVVFRKLPVEVKERHQLIQEIRLADEAERILSLEASSDGEVA